MGLIQSYDGMYYSAAPLLDNFIAVFLSPKKMKASLYNNQLDDRAFTLRKEEMFSYAVNNCIGYFARVFPFPVCSYKKWKRRSWKTEEI